MDSNKRSEEWQLKRSRAVKTAWLLAIIATAIFATFIGSAIIGR